MKQQLWGQISHGLRKIKVIKFEHKWKKNIIELAYKNSTHTNKMPFSSLCKRGTSLVIHSIFKLYTFCKALSKFKYSSVCPKQFFFLNEQKWICILKFWTFVDARFGCNYLYDSVNSAQMLDAKLNLEICFLSIDVLIYKIGWKTIWHKRVKLPKV